jgi:hypothetical protein
MKERGLRSLLVALKSGNMQLIKVLRLVLVSWVRMGYAKDPCNPP